MGITAYSGPIVSYGQLVGNSTNGLTGSIPADSYNTQRAPNISDLGYAMGDPRYAYQYDLGGSVTSQTFGFYDSRGTVDYAPTALSSNLLSISSNNAPAAGAAITLLSSKTGVTATTIIAPETGVATGSLLCIDSTAAYVGYGSDATICLWNPAGGAGRALVISPSSNSDGGSFSVAGRDIYGYKMTETFAAGSTTITGKKAFKYISSIVSATTITSTGVGIGTTDIYGFPFLVSYAGPVNLSMAMSSGAGGGDICTSVSATSGNVVFASTVATQTSTTPDVRGTFTSSLASGSSARLQIIVRPTVGQLANVTSSNVANIFGGVQFSSV